MSPRAAALLCFFLSGATGLLYEVVWIRLLGFTLGNTHHSITIVVSVFMGGLALGSFFGGKIADRSPNPLRLYGLLLLGIGAFCLAVPLLIDLCEPLFRWIYRFHEGSPEARPLLLAKLAAAAAIILVPTTLMGATLPALSRYFTRSLGSVGWDFGRLYAVNTFGAVCGAFLTGFAGIPLLGLWGCILLGVLVDFILAAVVLVMARGLSGPAERPAASARGPSAAAASGTASAPGGTPTSAAPIIFAFAASGFANMILQIAWTKALIGTIGNSTYAFSLIVTLFILGIGLGSALGARWADRVRNVPLALGLVLLSNAGVILAAIPALGFLPVFGAWVFHDPETASPTFGGFLLRQAGIVALIILPATTLMGMVFPLVGKWVTRSLEEVGRSIGGAYFANTLGSILGTLAAGFILVPLLGRVFWSLYIAFGIILAVGIFLCLLYGRGPALRGGVVGAVALALAFAYVTRPHGVLPSGDGRSQNRAWHPAIQSLGVYIFHEIARGATGFFNLADRFIASNTVLYFREGVHAPVAVVEQPNTRRIVLRISGKPEGSAAPDVGFSSDMPHQLGAAHLPVLLHPGPEEVLTLGLGSGVTLGSLTLYSQRDGAGGNAAPGDHSAGGTYTVASIDSLEISGEVIEAVDKYFAGVNHNAVRHPRVRHVLGDGRNHLLYTHRRYDVITSVPSNPWIAGIGNLFTEEFFEIVRDRLEPGGIFCQWIHTLRIRAEDFRMVLRTFQRAFPEHLQLWDLGYDCLLVGSDRPIRIDRGRLAAALRDPLISRELGVLGIGDLAGLTRYLRMGAPEASRFAGAGPTNRDLFPYLEFSAPRGLHGEELDAFRELIRSPVCDLEPAVAGAEPEELARCAAFRGRFLSYQKLYAEVSPLRGNLQALLPRLPELAEFFQRAVAEGDAWLASRAVDLVGLAPALQMGRNMVRENRPEAAIRVLEGLLPHIASSPASDPIALETYHALGIARAQRGEYAASEQLLRQALATGPPVEKAAALHYDLGYSYEIQGLVDRAAAEYRQALKILPAFQAAGEGLSRLGRAESPR